MQTDARVSAANKMWHSLKAAACYCRAYSHSIKAQSTARASSHWRLLNSTENRFMLSATCATPELLHCHRKCATVWRLNYVTQRDSTASRQPSQSCAVSQGFIA